jgi:Golgi to ER traffic protein 4
MRSSRITPVTRQMPPAPSSSRALAAILPQISTAPYEAHQKARTFASRYVKAAQYDVAIDVLFQSARELLKVGQQGSGTDLGGFMLEVYESKGEAITEESRGQSLLCCAESSCTNFEMVDRTPDSVNCFNRFWWLLEKNVYRQMHSVGHYFFSIRLYH